LVIHDNRMKGKVKKVKVSIANDKDIGEMFNQMINANSVNINIAYPRYNHIKELCERIIKVFTLLAESPLLSVPYLHNEKLEILAFCANSKLIMQELFCADLSQYILDFNSMPPNITDQFIDTYQNIKKSEFIKKMISIADTLYPYRENFQDIDALKHNFIYDISGIEWSPLPFSLNIKEIVSSDIAPNSIEFIMTVICKVYGFSMALYNDLRSPDIDIDQFINIIISSISELQKRPELNRCDKAFNKIKDSVLLLKSNFNDYYRDFIATKDNTIIMEHFILDVSNNTKADPELTRQFRKIISYYHDVARQQGNTEKNDQIDKLFDKLNAELKLFDNELVNIKKDETQ